MTTKLQDDEGSQPGEVRSSDRLGLEPERAVPVAEVKCGRLRWHIPRDDYSVPARFLNNETHFLYDQAALDAAVADALAHERVSAAEWRALAESLMVTHISRARLKAISKKYGLEA